MNFLPVFSAWQFAVAGLVCTGIPVVIHLLYRRRYRIVQWGAMRFLQEAVQQKRRVMRLRDIILLLLRMAAIACFGLALSQPYFAARSQQLDAGQPVHAVLLIDNSLSMGHQTLAGNDLDAAKQRAAGIIDRLPAGSRISIVPVCGSKHPRTFEPYDAKPQAIEALQRIEVVDRSMTIRQAINEARRAVETTPDMPARVVLFSDQQETNWIDFAGLKNENELPDIQMVQVTAAPRDNTWVAEIEIQDGVADAQTPAVIHAVLKHRGSQPRSDVRVGLWVNNEEVASQIVQFATAEATRDVTFEHTFRQFQPLPNQPSFVPVKVSLAPDHLTADDERHLLAPIVAELPVTFVDQYGEDEEDALLGRFGETRHLRHLLSPGAGGDSHQLVTIQHRTIEQLDRELIDDSRLVVMAGIASPADKVRLLRQYVERGGQLVIAAGANFDPAEWNQAAWLNGDGILPLPLLAEPIGALPESAEKELRPFYLSFESLSDHPYFQLAGNSEDDLRDLYAEPFFFKAVQVDETPIAGRPQSQTQVLARFTSERGPPFLVEKRIGEGRVLLVTSGLLSSWNTLPKTNAMVIFDRILREMIQSTLPQRNYGAIERISIPIADEVRDAQIVLQRPGAASVSESLDTGFVSEDQFGVVIERPLTRGIYQLAAYGTQGATDSTQPTHWQFQVVVNGDADESDLTSMDRTKVEERNAGAALNWVDANEEISLAGVGIRGQDLWWWLALGVLFVLFLELLVLGVNR
jgi:hypothetical protein